MEELAISRLIWVLIATALLSLVQFESARQAYWLAYRRGHFSDGLWLGMLLGPLGWLLASGWPQLPVPNIANHTRRQALADNQVRGRFQLALAVLGAGVVLVYYSLAAFAARLPVGPSPGWLLPAGLLLVGLGALLLRQAHPPFNLLPVVEGEFPEEDPEFITGLKFRRQHECLEASKRTALQGIFWFRAVAVLSLLPNLVLWLGWAAYRDTGYLLGGLGLLAATLLLAWAAQRCIRVRERCDELQAQQVVANAPTSVHREYFERFQRVRDLQRTQQRLDLHCCMVGCTWPLLLLGLLVAVFFVGWQPWQSVGAILLAAWIVELVLTYRLVGPFNQQADDYENNQQRMRDLEALMEEYEVDRAAQLEKLEGQETIYLQAEGMLVEKHQLTPEQRSLLDKARLSEIERQRVEALEAGAAEDEQREQEAKLRLGRFSACTYSSGCLLIFLTAAVGIYSEFWAPLVGVAGFLLFSYGVMSMLQYRWRRFRSRGCWLSLAATFVFLWTALVLKAGEYSTASRVALGWACLTALLAAAYLIECLRRKYR